MIYIKTYDAPPISKKEALRYAQCHNPQPDVAALLDECTDEVCPKLTYKVCYCRMNVTITDNVCDFEHFSLVSKALAKNLADCDEVILFAATVGVEIDRFTQKYSRLSPAKAIIMNGLGAERVESLCDMFCKDYEQSFGVKLRPRVSPGYGDLELKAQKDIFKILDCKKNIGIGLNNNLMMSPSKSVTAFAGIPKE